MFNSIVILITACLVAAVLGALIVLRFSAIMRVFSKNEVKACMQAVLVVIALITADAAISGRLTDYFLPNSGCGELCRAEYRTGKDTETINRLWAVCSIQDNCKDHNFDKLEDILEDK